MLLTDTAGLLSADPRHNADATLIEEVTEIDHELEEVAGPAASHMSRGGMSSKLAAAKMAVWSGSKVVIASARRPAVLADAVEGYPASGRSFCPSAGPLGHASSGSPSLCGPPAGSSSTRVPAVLLSKGASPCCRQACLAWRGLRC